MTSAADSSADEAVRRVFLVAGSGGMLGTALQQVLAEQSHRFIAPAEKDFDITDPTAVEATVRGFAAALGDREQGVLVNAAAYTNVERAEDEPVAAYRVNEDGARLLAEAAASHGLAFIHVSTDFVFDGEKDAPYNESDTTNPLSVYGRSKLAGEVAVREAHPDALVVRTAWVFGPGGANFPSKILEAARTRGELSVVDDEVGSPTYTIDLAAGILGLVFAEAGAGTYHLANSGSVSRYDFAGEVLRLAGVHVPVRRAKAADFPSKARRPKNSVLDCGKARAYGVVMPAWQDALGRFLR